MARGILRPMRLFKARAVWLSGVSLAVLGTLPVLYAVGLFVWQFGNRALGGPSIRLHVGTLFTDHPYPYLPGLPAEWLQGPWTGSPEAQQALAAVLSAVHVGWLFAVPGLLLAALGAWIVLRQAAAIEVERRRREDRLRRVRVGQYAGRERVEPFFGPGEIAESPERKKEAA
jgi:hypothetical protein